MSATTNCLNGSLLTFNTFVSVMYCYLANECQINKTKKLNVLLCFVITNDVLAYQHVMHW